VTVNHVVKSEGQTNSKPLISHAWIIEHLLWIQPALWALVVVSAFVYGYHSIFWSEAQVYLIEDSWCSEGEGVGRHCFGDFGLPYNNGYQDSTYVPGNIAATNTPLMALAFELLRMFSYNTSLALYLSVLATCLIAPFTVSSSYVSQAKRVQLAVFFGLISVGGIAALDRGNHVVVFVPLLVGYLLSIERKRWLQAAIFLALMSMMKFWGFIFVIALIAKSKFRYAVGSMLVGGVTSVIVLSYFPGPLSITMTNMLKAAGDQDFSRRVMNFAISIKGLVGRTGCLLRGELNCNSAIQRWEFITGPWLGLVIAISLIVFVYVLIRVRIVPPILWMSVLISLGIIAVPDGPIYQASLVTAIVALLTLLPNSDSLENWKWSSRLLIMAIIFSSSPLTLYLAGEPFPFRSYYLTIPSAWLVFYFTILIELALLCRKGVARK